MRVLAFDGRTGASGDMLLGALLDAGGSRSALEPVEAGLDLEYTVEPVTRGGIEATGVTVGRDGDPIEGRGPARSYAEVVGIVEALDLSEPVMERARSAFRLLGEAEAAVHGTDLETTHFHEVGADDAIADVVGVALLLDEVDPDGVVTTPVAAGGGTVETAHGEYPVPPPAVVEIASRAGWRLVGGPVEAELLTPTGAALLGALADGVDALPALRLERVGYGAGSADLEGRPNVLRALVGEAGGLDREEIAVLETTVDDVSPEVLGGLHEALADAGARDVAVLPATMKKARPGHLVQVIVDPADADRVAARLAAETGTLGVRQSAARHRWVAERAVETVELDLEGGPYEVGVKVARTGDGEVYDVSAEFDDAAAVAAATGLAVREVMRRAEAAVHAG